MIHDMILKAIKGHMNIILQMFGQEKACKKIPGGGGGGSYQIFYTDVPLWDLEPHPLIRWVGLKF